MDRVSFATVALGSTAAGAFFRCATWAECRNGIDVGAEEGCCTMPRICGSSIRDTASLPLGKQLSMASVLLPLPDTLWITVNLFEAQVHVRRSEVCARRAPRISIADGCAR